MIMVKRASHIPPTWKATTGATILLQSTFNMRDMVWFDSPKWQVKLPLPWIIAEGVRKAIYKMLPPLSGRPAEAWWN